MAYRFKKDEALPRAIQRVFAEEISWAVGQLVRSKKRVEAVHEARKSIKKIRALLSLLAPHHKQQDRYFRDAGKVLSNIRDNSVMLQVFDAIVAKHPELEALSVKEIRSNLLRSNHRFTTEKDASSQVLALLQQAQGLALQDTPIEAIRKATEETYERGRRSLKRARKERTAESLHSFRKQVKQHWYHLRLFEFQSSSKILDDLHDLETWLGDHHNLSVLRERLNSEVETRKDRQQIKQLVSWIDDESAGLQKRALELGERLYAEKALRPPKLPARSVPLPSRSAVA